MTADLIARLRAHAEMCAGSIWQQTADLENEAADALERLTPTAEDRQWAEYIANRLDAYSDHPASFNARAAALLRRYVLREGE